MSGEGIEQRGRLVGAARFGEDGVEFTKGVRIAREIEARQGEQAAPEATEEVAEEAVVETEEAAE